MLVVGTVHGWGARRWFDLGYSSLQPSEFAKLAFILAQAHFLSRPAEELRSPAELLAIHRPDDVAVCLIHERAGPRLRACVAADRPCDACSWPARQGVSCSGSVGLLELLAALFLVDVFVRAARLVDSQTGRLSTPAAAGLFRRETSCPPMRLRLEKVKAGEQEREKFLPGAPGVDLGRLGRALGQRLASGQPDRFGFFAARRGA